MLQGLKTSKAAGPDKISARLVKDSAEVICQTLTLIFNRSLQQGIFPEDLKTAFVSPIFKDGDKADCSNYRPISVLSIVAKIFEKIVYNQLITYIDENNILSNNQFGFRKSHSTSTSMLDATNNWLLNIDKGLINGVLFLDLRKAFDTCGVPQGSNLGPLLFLIYVNDLPNCLQHSKPSMFADDTNVSIPADSLEELEVHLNSDLDNIHQWLVANKLTLNVSKTEYMIIGSRSKLSKITENPMIRIGNEFLNRVNTTKSLGVIIDDRLRWEDHIDSISKKVSRGIGAIKLIKPFVPESILKQIYNALVQPYFDYCFLVWQNCNLTLQSKLQKLQNRAARVITGDSWEICSTDVLSKLNWRPLNQLRLEGMLLFMRKVLKNEFPNSITEQFQIAVNDQYNLRSNHTMLMLPKPRTNAMKRSFS